MCNHLIMKSKKQCPNVQTIDAHIYELHAHHCLSNLVLISIAQSKLKQINRYKKT
uniref:Uncharacterized protein n=1 Tax=Arundo donax TaxID=35708 RepID=A0A0A8YFL9_ARUDO